MIAVHPYETLGQADHGWLKARHHFSFANYRNDQRVRFGQLRVINDDTVQAGAGFDMHPHRDMEIITFVRSGAITHRDSRGHSGRTAAGNVQVMSAGTGIYHSEFNLESEETTLYQIWIYPKVHGVKPCWDMAMFADRQATDQLPLLVSGRAEDQGRGALYIHQDASIAGGRLQAGQELSQPIRDQAYVLISQGDIEIQGQRVKQGDGVEITDLDNVTIKALSAAEVILIDVPA